MKNKQNKSKQESKLQSQRLSIQALKQDKRNNLTLKNVIKGNTLMTHRSHVNKSKNTKVIHSARQKCNQQVKKHVKQEQSHRDTPQLGKLSADNPHLQSFGNLFAYIQQMKKQQPSAIILKQNTSLNVNTKQKINNKNICSQVSKIQQSKVEQSLINVSQLSEGQLDLAIGRLKSKKNTVQLLNKTINHKLVQSFQTINKTARSSIRSEVLDLQINYYVQKITQLQKQLQQKNRIIEKMAVNHNQLNLITKNNKKLADENVRLREYLQLSHRQNEALRTLINKKKNLL